MNEDCRWGHEDCTCATETSKVADPLRLADEAEGKAKYVKETCNLMPLAKSYVRDILPLASAIREQAETIRLLKKDASYEGRTAIALIEEKEVEVARLQEELEKRNRALEYIANFDPTMKAGGYRDEKGNLPDHAAPKNATTYGFGLGVVQGRARSALSPTPEAQPKGE